MKKFVIGCLLGIGLYHFGYLYFSHQDSPTKSIQPSPKSRVEERINLPEKRVLQQEMTPGFLPDLGDSSNDTDMISHNLQNASPEVRKASIEKAIEVEDTENKYFEDSIVQLIITESNSEVLESALSYLSLTNSQSIEFSVQQILDKNDLSVELMSYVGEVLYEDMRYDSTRVLDMLRNSPNYSHFENVDLVRLHDFLNDVFSKPNITSDEDEPQIAEANDD